MSRPHLIIPSEIQVREFDSKLLLACMAAERGYRATIGSRAAIHNSIASLPKGIYIAKDAAPTSAKMFRILQGLGTSIVAWDEEGFFYYSTDLFVRRRIIPENLSRVARYLVWGDNQLRGLQSHPFFASTRLVSTGNPRTDLLRPELRSFHGDAVEDLRRRFGPMILVNSNFGRLNHFLSHRTLTPSAPGDLAHRNLEDADPPLEIWRLRERVMKAFVALIPQLARAFPDRTIVMRPHPAENHQLWIDAAAGCENVRVIHEGNVVPWLMAADVTIHNGCTTGVESYLLDRPTIAYRPVRDPARELMLPNDLSADAPTVDDVIDLAKSAVAGRWCSKPGAAALADLAATFDGLSGPLASDRVLAVIDEMVAEQESWPSPSAQGRKAAHHQAALRAVSKRFQAVLPFHKNHRRHHTHRFPGLTQAAVETRIDRLGQCLGRFNSVRLHTLEDNVFEVFAR
jgi:surface carbohydrate biosynthesis protein